MQRQLGRCGFAGANLKKAWRKAPQALARCRADAATCSGAEARLIDVIDSVRGVEGRAKLGIVNREINLSIAYTSDRLQHAPADVWSSAADDVLLRPRRL